jgi:hypothetical protein
VAGGRNGSVDEIKAMLRTVEGDDWTLLRQGKPGKGSEAGRAQA